MLGDDFSLYEEDAPVGMRPLRIDPCRDNSSFSWVRFLFFALIFLAMVPACVLLLIFYRDRPYGIECATLICYTYAVVLYTFSSARASGNRYLFSCPWVRRTLPRIVLRHVAFLIALFVLQATALHYRPHLSTWWLTPNGRGHTSPFAGFLLILCLALGLTQIISNRSLLDKAHLDYAA